MNGVVRITQAEYARRRGVAKSAVAKAVDENRISLIDGMIDPVVADIQWERNTRARADAGRSTTTADAGAGPSAAPPVAGGAPDSEDGRYSFNRARRERYEADLAELRLREEQGDLVRLNDVRAEIETRVGQVRTNLLQLPARLAPIFANESDQAKIHAQLDSEIRQVLSSVSRQAA